MPGHVLFSMNRPLALGDLDPHLILGSLGPLKSTPKWHLDRFSHFYRAAKRGQFNRIGQVAPMWHRATGQFWGKGAGYCKI